MKYNSLEIHDRTWNLFNPNKKYKWSDIYKNEEEMIADLHYVESEAYKKVMDPFAPIYLGYEYIHSFAKQVKEGKQLSKKQITQCKRLAKEIKKARVFGEYIREISNS